MTYMLPKSPEPTAGLSRHSFQEKADPPCHSASAEANGAVRSAVAVYAARLRWLSLFRSCA
jgi:hypothetical protein